MHYRVKQDGFAILVVLVAVAILMMLYFVQIDTFFGHGPRRTEPAGIENHPWVLEDLLVTEDENIKLPRKPKLQWDRPLSLTAPVMLDSADRGKVTIVLDAEGRIEASWECTYVSDGMSYGITSLMTGNIDSKRTYRNDNGKDKNRLFFIARGHYTKTPLESTERVGGEKGTAWLTGWIDPDCSVQGHVTITTDQTWAAVYRFETGSEI